MTATVVILTTSMIKRKLKDNLNRIQHKSSADLNHARTNVINGGDGDDEPIPVGEIKEII